MQPQLDIPQWVRPLAVPMALATTFLLAIGYTHLRREYRHPCGVLLLAMVWNSIIIYGLTSVAFPTSPVNISLFIIAIIVLNGVFWAYVTGSEDILGAYGKVQGGLVSSVRHLWMFGKGLCKLIDQFCQLIGRFFGCRGLELGEQVRTSMTPPPLYSLYDTHNSPYRLSNLEKV
ncbi:hypothetical protein BDR04DRAFT_1111441 [Suillus decipiens]|nr:hypothetical protein BDR04DRAFT_1111441 [Suillus decipiens]